MRALFSIPNAFSFARIVLAVFFAKALFGDYYSQCKALVFFSLAVMTDLFDGYVARRYNSMTRWGAFLDPIADKFLVFAAFISFCLKGLVPGWVVLIVCARDVVVTALRFKLLYAGINFKTSLLAKGKTVAQFLVVYCMFAYIFAGSSGFFGLSAAMIEMVMNALLYSVVGLTSYSGVEYVYRYMLSSQALFIFSQTHER